MTIYYIDHTLGNDTNDGSEWGDSTAWKTLALGATAARLVSGDEVRVAKTPDPTLVGTCSWSNQSDTITLPSVLTKNVEVEGTTWTASDNVTCGTNVSRKIGSYASQFAIGAGFTTGKVAYKTLGSVQDFSGYQQLSFWLTAVNAAIAANVLKVCLCSDTTGDTIVDSFIIPVTPGGGYAYNITIDKGSALGSSIQSVTIYADSDPGTVTFSLSCIIACKAASSADSITLSSLISKSSNAIVGANDDGWYGIKSINGTTLILDINPGYFNSVPLRSYFGTTESVSTYKREPVKVIAAEVFNEAGVTYTGGYNTSSGVVDGETFIELHSYWSCNISVADVTISGFSFVRGNYGFYEYPGCTGTINIGSISNCSTALYATGNTASLTTNVKCLNNNVSGLYLQGKFNTINIDTVKNSTTSNAQTSSASQNAINIGKIYNGAGSGLQVASSWSNTITVNNAEYNTANGILFNSACNNVATIGTANFNTQSGLSFQNALDNVVTATDLSYNYAYAIYFGSVSANNIVKGFDAHSNVSGVFNVIAGAIGNRLYNWTTNQATIGVFATPAPYIQKVFSGKENNDQLDSKIYLPDSRIARTDNSIRYTASDVSWKIPSGWTSYCPFLFSIAKIACAANAQVTVSAYLRRDSINVTSSLLCQKGQIAGVSSDVRSTISVDADTWQQITLQFTPTEEGVVEIFVEVYGGATTNNTWIDDISISQE